MGVPEILDDLLAREGGWRDQVTRPDGSVDPATHRGITLLTLKYYRERYLGTPRSETTEADLRALTDAEARQIYAILYVQEPGFTEANIPFEPLRVQLVDFGVNSGSERAIRWLQRVLRLEPTGRMDGLTRVRLETLRDHPLGERVLLPLVNDALVAARSYMIDALVDGGQMRKADEEGVESRALSFFLARP